jgi:hypothetical protein
MPDFFMFLIVVIFFLACLGLMTLCESLMEG